MVNTYIVGDFSPYQKKLENGEMSYDEYRDLFSKARIHGLNYIEDMERYGKPQRPYIKGCAVGGSTAAKIAGISDYGGPAGVAAQFYSLIKAEQEETMPLFIGHVFEAPIREVFARMKRDSGISKVVPSPFQYANRKYPHLLANVDGIVYEEDEDGKVSLGLYEGKTVYNTKGAHGETFIKADTVPEDYMLQVQFYLEILDLDFAWVCAAWGITESSMRSFRIARDRELGESVCSMCESFAKAVDDGKIPENSGVSNIKARLKDLSLMYPHGDCRLPQVKLPKEFLANFRQADMLSEKIAAVRKEMEGPETQIKLLKEALKPCEKELALLDMQMKEALVPVAEYLKDSTLGILSSDGVTYRLAFPEEKGFSKDAKAMAALKREYPKAYEFLSNFKPKERTFSYMREG